MLVNREVVLCKIESTYNTDPTPVAATNAILVTNASWAHEGLRMNARNSVKPSLSGEQQVFGGTLKTISFDMEIKGSGAAGTAPECGVPLRVCGFGETIVASTSVTYDLVSTGSESATFYYFQDGLRHVLTGCRGTVSSSREAGGFIMYSFTITGHSGAPTDVALPTPTLDSTLPEPFKGATFTMGGYASVINSLAVDVGNSMAMSSSVNGSDGYGQIRITERDVNGSFDPESTLVATKDYYGEFLAGTNVALSVGAIGATAGNIITESLPVVYYRDISPGDREGIRIYEIPFGAIESSGDDEWTIAFT